MIELLEQLEFWHWFILGFVLLGIETIGVGGFLIGISLAALLQGATVYFIPEMTWQMQTVIFGFDAIVFSFIFWKFFPRSNDGKDHPSLNNKASSLIGTVVELENDIENGSGHIFIGDTRWKVKSGGTVKKGSKAEVTSVEGMVLIIEEKTN